MCNQNEWIVRDAFLAYDKGDVGRMMDYVHPDLEWTSLDPGQEDPRPQVHHGRAELEQALRLQAQQGLRAYLEEVIAADDRVLLVMRTPGLGEFLHRTGADKTYDVLTLRDGLIVELHACRDHNEARSLAGIA